MTEEASSTTLYMLPFLRLLKAAGATSPSDVVAVEALLRASVDVVEAHDVVFTQIAA